MRDRSSYIEIYDWMIEVLDLSGKELLVYAAVYNLVECELKDIMRFTGLTDKETFATLQRLKEYKKTIDENGKVEFVQLVDRYKKDKKAYYFVNEELLF